MYPTAATIEAAEEPTRLTPDIDVLGHLCDAADRIQKLAADCVAVSFAYAHDDVTLTLVASGEEQQSLLNSDLNEVSSFLRVRSTTPGPRLPAGVLLLSGSKVRSTASTTLPCIRVTNTPGGSNLSTTHTLESWRR